MAERLSADTPAAAIKLAIKTGEGIDFHGLTVSVAKCADEPRQELRAEVHAAMGMPHPSCQHCNTPLPPEHAIIAADAGDVDVLQMERDIRILANLDSHWAEVQTILQHRATILERSALVCAVATLDGIALECAQARVHQTRKGGQTCGIPAMAGVPMSVLMRLQRDCENAVTPELRALLEDADG